jgi:hypothetical protein
MPPRTEPRSPQPLPMGWPVDANGKPLAMVSMAASELVNLGNYSNVTVGPAMVTRFVEDTPQSRAQGLKECTVEVEDVVARERQVVYETLVKPQQAVSSR